MDVADLTPVIQSVVLDDDDIHISEAEVSSKSSSHKKKTLEEIKNLIGLRDNPTVSFVIIGKLIWLLHSSWAGHVDAGKSTLMGRLLYDLKAVDERTMQKYRQESQKAGKGSFALAWVMDQSEEERKRYVTNLCDN